MRFLISMSYEPDKAKEVTERFKKWVTPEGVKTILPTITVMGRNRSVTVWDVDDPKLLAILERRWRDLGVLEILPIMESTQIAKIQ
jgi:hypothetical protein